MKKSLLDTSILIAFLRGGVVVFKVKEYLEKFDKLSLSIILRDTSEVEIFRK